ncbi:diguanylate cyclase [Angustibacter sp. McL0619]|uniref:GGDEF domain-containing protein n=1 Tax=Angustibacter sp. McL0619 TaxID=3415676 RepID=UPI003CF920D3
MPLPDADGFLGAHDVLVFRRVGSRWTHLGGLGRGAAWAGSVQGQELADPRLEAALSHGRPVRRHGQKPHRVLGPYSACTSAVVRLDAYHAVVLGSVQPDPQLLGLDDGQLVELAARACELVTQAAPAKHLADELVVLSALRDLATAAPVGVDALLYHLAASTAEALSCALAAVWLDDDRHAVATPEWIPDGGAQRAVVVARTLAGKVEDVLVVQDACEQPLPAPIGATHAVSAYLAVPVEVDGVHGCMLLVHSPGTPSTFTPLCEQLAVQLARAGSRMLEVATTHDELVRQLDSTREYAIRDPLTGAANRRGWDEAVARARDHVAAGGTVTVVSVDLDDLKVVNDTHGHAAGDELIIAAAHALRRTVRGQPDVIARLGGDEFALLLRGYEIDPVEIADRLRRSLERTLTGHGLPLRSSVGAAACPPRGSLDDAIRRADVEMYRDKRARRQSD